MKKLNKKKIKWIVKERDKKRSLEKAVKHYNYKKPHRSLTNGKLRTPYQTFIEKFRK